MALFKPTSENDRLDTRQTIGPSPASHSHFPSCMGGSSLGSLTLFGGEACCCKHQYRMVALLVSYFSLRSIFYPDVSDKAGDTLSCRRLFAPGLVVRAGVFLVLVDGATWLAG